MLFDDPEGLGGNIAYEEFSDDIAGNKRPDGWPAPREIVHNTDVHQRSIRFQKPGHFHASTDATHMRKMDTVLERIKALARRPAHWKAITMRRHLYQAFCRVS
jgi:hypothetical protein